MPKLDLDPNDSDSDCSDPNCDNEAVQHDADNTGYCIGHAPNDEDDDG